MTHIYPLRIIQDRAKCHIVVVRQPSLENIVLVYKVDKSNVSVEIPKNLNWIWSEKG